jgi:two-component system chemotaxis sensor kinase CheA
MMTPDDADLTARKEFLAEFEDLLENLNADLVTLEETLGSGAEDPELINSLFRSFHTIKGLAGMLSLDPIGNLAHALEDLLDAARLGKLEVNEGILRLLFRGVEILNAQAKAVSSNDIMHEEKSFIEQVRQTMRLTASTAEAVPDAVKKEDDFRKALTEYEEHRLRENLKSGKKIYLVRKSFSFSDFDTRLAEVTARLKSHGEVVSTLPGTSADDPSAIQFDLVWATPLDPAEIPSRVPVTAGELTPWEAGPETRASAARDEDEGESPGTSLRSVSETVRVDIKRLNNLMNIVGELVIYKTHLGEIAREFTLREGTTAISLGLNKAVKSLDRTLNFLQTGVIEARMVPIGQTFSKLRRMIRKLSSDLRKEVDLRTSGEETELDKLVIEDMADPLLHIIRNAIDHGIETPAVREQQGKPRRGRITLSAAQKGSHIIISIEDDGAGIDIQQVRALAEARGLLEPNVAYDTQHILSVLFQPGFSTASNITEVSGRGVGMDVVKNNVSRLRGMIDLDTALGRGTTVTITLPMTLAIIQALMVRVSSELFAVPINSVLESVKIGADQIIRIEGKEVYRLRDGILPLLRLSSFFGLDESADIPAKGRKNLYVVVVGLAEKRLGLVVDSLRGQQEIVIKTLGTMLKSVRGIAGATELGDRRAILVLDVGSLIQEVTHAG